MEMKQNIISWGSHPGVSCLSSFMQYGSCHHFVQLYMDTHYSFLLLGMGHKEGERYSK